MGANLHHSSKSQQAGLVRVRTVECLDGLTGWERVERSLGRVVAVATLKAGEPVDAEPAQAAIVNGETVHIQIRKRGLVLCARLVDVHDVSGALLIEAETKLGRFWVTQQNTRVCSGDGRCLCASAGAAGGSLWGGPRRASARAVPLGNTGTTTVEGA